jgi:hypothetical protein
MLTLQLLTEELGDIFHILRTGYGTVPFISSLSPVAERCIVRS